MKTFAFIKQIYGGDLDKIDHVKLRTLRPARQVTALRTWVDQNIRKRERDASDDEMRKFIKDAAAEFGVNTDDVSFKAALKLQRGWGAEWKAKVVDKNGAVIDLDTIGWLSDVAMMGKVKEIVEGKGANDHGDSVVGKDNGTHKHWRLGSNRIFGTFKDGAFTLIGFGRHKGKGNNEYNVDLIIGGTTTAVNT